MPSSSPWLRRDEGGQVDPTQTGGLGAMAPSVSTMDPLTRNLMQRYAGLPTEKLQELSGMMGASQQGRVVQSLLRQRQMQPNAQQGQAQGQGQVPGQGVAGVPGQQPITNPAAVQQQQQPTMRRGGGLAAGPFPRRASGGDMLGMSPSVADPWWTRSESAGMDRGATGYLNGSTMGRADSLKTSAPAGSYVIPAAVVSGLGEGNSLAGARLIQEAMATGPWGTPLPRVGHGAHLPHPQAPRMGGQDNEPQAARGGSVGTVPVRLSHGEYVLTAEEVLRIGDGNKELGLKRLDRFVEEQIKKLAKEIKKLPGPVKERAYGGGLR